MTHLVLDGMIRAESDSAVIATLVRKGWQRLPPQPQSNATWSGEAWIVPPPSTPSTVSPRQIRLWLIQRGISLASVDAAINGIEDATTRESVRVEWEYAPYVERSHPMLAPLAAALGLTADDVDQAFCEASEL